MKAFQKRLIGFSVALVMLLGMIATFAYAKTEDDYTYTISMEGETLGQGLYVEPTSYTLSQINTLVATKGYGPYSAEDLTPAIVTIAMMIDKNMQWQNSGDLQSFYLQAVQGVDKGTLNIPEIITENGGPSNEENDGNDDDYLGEFDYSTMSGWMVTVDHYMIHVGVGAYTQAEAEGAGHTFSDGSVIRWHFTLYGYGGDLGFNTGWGMPPYFEAANKDELYKEYAKLNDAGFFESHAGAKQAALNVMEDLTATQQQVDAALTALNAAAAGGVRKDEQTVLNETLANLAATVPAPSFGTAAGEWSVLALARGGYYATDDSYFTDYYNRITETVNTTAASVNLNGALHKIKSTENSRLILALSAIGKDARSVGNYNLVAPFEDFSWIKKQGINGPVFALIALDSHDYPTTDTTIRTQCIDYLLSKQLSDGGWALSGSSADPDMTAMTLQALAPYTVTETVAEACEKGFAALSALQKDTGGFASWGSVNCESIAQVIVACTAHQIDPNTDARFVKNGRSAVDALLDFYDADKKAFHHVADDNTNAMATDQAAYALVAHHRFLTGKNALYRMNDAFQGGENESLTATLSLPAKLDNSLGATGRIAININRWNNDGNYKLIDCILSIPDALTVTAVTPSELMEGGAVQYYMEEATGKLRLVYFDAQSNTSLRVKGDQFPAALFYIDFAVKEVGQTGSKLPIAIDGMSVKLRSDAEDATSMIVVNTDNAQGSMLLVDKISFSAVCLYQGDGIDLIPADKKAVAVFATALEESVNLTYQKDNQNIAFLYNEAISQQAGQKCYVAIVPAEIPTQNFSVVENFAMEKAATPDSIFFCDVNSDGVTNAQDALAAIDFWLRKRPEPTDLQILALNVNSDSRINTFDALGIVENFVDGTTPIIVRQAANLAARS